MNKLIYIIIVLVLLVSSCDKKPKDAQLLVDRGKALLDAGYPQDALELYRKASIKDSSCEDAYLQTAILYDEYLNDRQNAIVAYEKFLSISQNPIMRERVQTWLLEVRKTKEIQTAKDKKIDQQAITDLDLEIELAQREDQFKMLKEQLVERYEAKLETLQQKILEADEKVVALENENNILKSDSTKKEISQLMESFSSNEIIIANLEAKLDEKKQENKTAVQSLKALQDMVADLQNKSYNSSEGLFPAGTLSETNTMLAAEIDILSLKLKTLETEKAELERKFLSKPKPTLTQTSEIYSDAKFESLITATNKIAELEQNISFLSQAKDNLVSELFKLRKVSENKSNQLTDLSEKYKQSQKSVLNSKSLQKNLEEEKKLSANWKKLFYDRTVSLKKLKQQYDNLYRRYQYELTRNKKISDTIAGLQDDLSGFKTTEKPSYNVGTKPSYKTKTTRQKSGPSRKGSKPRTYTVRSGDSLATIARRLYGDSEKWQLIFKANRDILNKPNQLRVGQILTIP